MSYLSRLQVLNKESLEERRKRNDVIRVYKLFHGVFKININDFFTSFNPIAFTRAWNYI